MIYPLQIYPAPARALSVAITRAVVAAQASDREAYEPAVVELTAGNPEQVSVVAGAVVRGLLEDLHPDGLDGDDVHVLLDRCVRAAATWLPGIDVTTLIVVLAGALGIHEASDPIDGSDDPSDPDDSDGRSRPPTRLEVARHAPLIIADLLTASGRRLGPYLDAAFAEIARAETQEMP